MKKGIMFIGIMLAFISCKKESTTDNQQQTTNLIVVTTTDVAQIASRSAIINATITNDGGHAITERGVCYATTENPTTANTVIQSGSGLGSYSVTITSLNPATTYYARTYATNSVGTVYGNQLSFTTLPVANLPSVQIGTQIWAATNLGVDTYKNGDPIPRIDDPTEWSTTTSGAYCYYLNQSSLGVVYGKLYNWYAVNDPRGLAPEGWHMSYETEWITLQNYLGGDLVAGGKLKEAGFNHWLSYNTGATNSSGFTALPGEGRGTDGTFSDPYPGYNATFWTSTLNGFDVAYYRLAVNNNQLWLDHAPKASGCSVRCIQD